MERKGEIKLTRVASNQAKRTEVGDKLAHLRITWKMEKVEERIAHEEEEMKEKGGPALTRSASKGPGAGPALGRQASMRKEGGAGVASMGGKADPATISAAKITFGGAAGVRSVVS